MDLGSTGEVVKGACRWLEEVRGRHTQAKVLHFKKLGMRVFENTGHLFIKHHRSHAVSHTLKKEPWAFSRPEQ